MNRHIIILFFICLNITLYGQSYFFEDFSDGDFVANPSWSGNIDKYIIYTGTAVPSDLVPTIRTNGSGTDTTFLVSAFNQSFVDSLEWSFWVKLSFNPSTGNFARIYICSNSENLENPLNGYYIALGYNGNDRITLVKQNGTLHTPLLVGSVADLNKSTNILRIKVKRYDDGTWKIYSDETGNTNYSLEGQIMDNSFTSSNYLGIFNQYTSSNATNFYFDEFYAGPVVIDTIKPSIISAKVINSFDLAITYSEAMNNSIFDHNNYLADHGLGNPTSVTEDPNNSNIVHLSWMPNPILDDTIYSLAISNVTDIAGNLLDTSIIFALHFPKAYDVLINEIMADPDPPVALPPYEYIELYNPNPFPINLENWKIKISTTTRIIGNVNISPNGFLIFCNQNATQDFENLPQHCQTYGFSSFSISNSGADITLYSPDDNVISFAAFKDTWYQDPLKSQGGYSVEMIDPSNPCAGDNNWRASNSFYGGTPGQINSIYGTNPDNIRPEILRAIIQNSNTLLILFTEPLDSVTALNVNNYTFDPLLSISQIKGNEPFYDKITIIFNELIDSNTIYTVYFNDSITDCVGNQLPMQSSARFAFGKIPEPYDIVINEILHDPIGNNTPFVELYNRSSKILDLKYCILANVDSIYNLDNKKSIAPAGFPIFPGEYIVLSKDKKEVLAQYYTPNPKNFIDMSLPNITKDSNTIVLALTNDTIIDMVKYYLTYHDPLLLSTDGVSLERVNPNRPSNESSNWHSAASSVGYATPAYKNSQYSDDLYTDEITIEPAYFSPDNDGFQDLLDICFNFKNPGYHVSITIFNLVGQPVRHILSQEYVGTQACYSWDGKDDDNKRCDFGWYIVYVSAFNTSADKIEFKKAISLNIRK